MQKTQIAGYEIQETLHNNRKGTIYRANRLADNTSVILKTLQNYPSPRDIARVKKEYEVLQGTHSPGIVQVLELKMEDQSPILVMQDTHGKSLAKLLKEREFGLQEKIEIALKLSQAIENIHQQEIIHLDIKPANSIYNTNSKEITIIDFGISTKLSRENPSIASPDKLEGTLAYLSPEQTGRMNRSIDYRADFYSLGITLYELFTGKLPFYSKDSMEMVHFHIAVEPKTAYQNSPNIPKAISNIIQKLMNKKAEDRYQGAYGICHDFHRCLELLKVGELESTTFTLATRDISEKFQIPQKLYGREKEIKKLLASFNRISNGSRELMIVKGYSGIGKSALVNEIHKPVVEKRGYFISGKFDQFKKDIPYSAIILAFQDLIRQLLTETEDKIDIWKTRILQAVGNNGQIIIDIIPEIEYIIGKQPAVAELGPSESQNRFNLVFKEFIKVFTAPEHPLVLFIDDMQWADSASLKFIENILADREIQHLLFILSYRDNEVNATHPLLATLDIIQKSGCPTNAIELSTLSLSDINLLVSESIKEESETSISLSSIVLQKTNGNPFFVSEFLKSLYEERLLNFNSIEGHWQWDENKIKNSGITENVVELMSAKIQKLSQETQKLLHLAACIGNRFDLKTLSTINRNSETQTAFDLQEALKEGIVQPIGDAYKYISEEKYEKIEYRFLHDRVQQAAYTLIPKNEKEMVHLSIGRHLLKNTKQEEMDENIFDIANHLNTGIALIQEKKEKDQLIAINHKAAMRAKQSNAYSSSLEFFKVASNLLQDREREYWQTKYSLTFSIFKNYSESQYLASNIEDAEILFDKTLQLAKTKLDKAEIYTMRITLLIGINRFQEALEVTAEAMKLFNVPIIANPNQIRVLREVAATKINIRRYLNNSDPNSILNLPELTNKEIKVIMRILMESCPAGYLYFPNALVVNALRMLNYSLKYGKSELTSYACGVMGIVSVGALHEYNDGVEFGEVSLKLNDEYKFMPCWGKVKFMFSLMQGAWRESLKDRLIPLLDEAYYSCQEAGDNLYGSYITMFGIYVKVYSSTVNLRVIYEEHIKYSTFIEQVKDEGLFLVYKLLIHMLLCFTLDSDESRKLDFQMESLTNVLQETNYTTGFNYQYLVNLQINYYHENYQEAIRYGFLAESTKDANLGQITNAGIPFYLSLAISSHYHKDLPFLSKVKYKSYMRKTIAKYKKWLANSQENFASKYYILLAEYTKVCDKNPTDLYERAIEESYKNDALGDTALANELAAKYHLSLNRSEIAKSYLLNARHYYHKWGAIVKIKQIDEKYPDLVKGVLAKVATGTDVIHDEERGTVSITTSTSGTRTQKKSTSTKMFDFNSVFKASQSLSREIQFQKLLEKLMQFLLENAGATKGFLLFNDNGTLKMEASGELKDKSIQVLQATPLKQAQGLSTSIVNYVMRTKENVVLLNAAGEGSYVNDPYIKQNKVQSLLCAPILNKGELSGIIYLENDLTTGAFTKDRIEILQILASQAAISIDNARLYDNLEGRVKQRTKEIGDIMNNVEQGIFTINEDLTINPEYSKKVIQIFARNDFGNKHFTAIFPQEIRSKLEMFLRQLFQNKFMSEKMFQSINPLKNYLLQLEKLNSKQLSFHFSRIYREDESGNTTKEIDKVMVVIDDKTEEYELQQQLEAKTEEQASKVEKLYQILNLEPAIFTDFLKEGSEVIAVIRGKLSGGTSKLKSIQNIEESYRAVHTLKGNARALNLDSIGEVCHTLEDELDKVRSNPEDVTDKLYQLVQEGIDKVDLELKDGNNLFDKILGMKSAIQNKLSSPLATLETMLRNSVQNESIAQNKSIDFSFKNKLVEEAPEDKVKILKNPLLQIIRNSIGHGLEFSQERKQAGKLEKGKITITLQNKDTKIVVSCEDDGRGLDTNKLKEKAIANGILTPKEAKNLSDAQVYQFIFRSGFSTAETITGTSGRGVGMDIVRSEIEKSGGTIEIFTELGKFTKFVITV